MNKTALALVVFFLGIGVLGYFVYFSMPLTLTEVAQQTDTEDNLPTSQPARDTATPTQQPTSTPATIDTLPTSTSTEPLPNQSETNTLGVTYDGSTFTPAMLQIKQGSKVIFTNESARPMWVASDNHPAHDLYPEFVQQGLSTPGGTYEFIFEKVGVWGYHNHLSPQQKGIITVVE